MGLYEDLQNDIEEAFNTDLSDAVKDLVFVSIIDTYDPLSMTTIQEETATTVRGVLESDFEGERIDEAPLTNSMKILVMDRDKGSLEFYVDMIIIDGVDSYKLRAFNPDPVNASWTIYARRLG